MKIPAFKLPPLVL